MKRRLTALCGSVVGLGLVVTGLLLVFAIPAMAQEPIKEEEKETQPICAPGRCGGDRVTDSVTFEAPENAVAVEVEILWKWDGHEGDGQVQENEYFTASFEGRDIRCTDFGDEGTSESSCGKTGRFDQSSDLKITFTHDDENQCFGRRGGLGLPACSSPGSIIPVAIVKWYVEARKPEPPILQVAVDCTGATFSGNTSVSMSLNYTLNDGQSGTIEVNGDFVQTVAWDPNIERQYGPHKVGATAELIDSGEMMAMAEASDTFICADPVGQVAVTVSCDGTIISGSVNTPMSLSYTLSDGQSRSIEVAGAFAEVVVWESIIQGQYGPHTVSAAATLVHEDQTIAEAEATDSDLTCDTPGGQVTILLDCDGATFEGAANTAMRLEYTMGNGQQGEFDVDSAAFSQIIPWQPAIQGQIGPHPVSVNADLMLDGEVIANIANANVLTCGLPEVRVNVDCDGATFTGQAGLSTDISYRLSDDRIANLRVAGNFSEFIPWVPAIQGKFGPHSVFADGLVISEARALSEFRAAKIVNCGPRVEYACRLKETTDQDGHPRYEPAAFDLLDDAQVMNAPWRVKDSNFNLSYPGDTPVPVRVKFPKKAGHYWANFEVNVDGEWFSGDACAVEASVKGCVTADGCGHQSQGKIGPVAFGTFTPHLQKGKDYFDLTRSVMFNAEYLNADGQGELVFRFNGEEMDDITTSVFNEGGYWQTNDGQARTVVDLGNGVTKLIPYRHGQEQGRVFQTNSTDQPRWIKPLDQPFEHKHDFQLALHGPPNSTDLLVYQDYATPIQYGANGVAVVDLSYSKAGLVGIYQTGDRGSVTNWTTVEALTGSGDQSINYRFGETGLNHYRVIDQAGQVVAGPSFEPNVTFTGEAGMTYFAQLVYPETSLYVAVHDYMDFKHPDYWTMPIDANSTQYHEFFVEHHREGDHVVIDSLTLLNATVSVAEQFPYGRHDGNKAGVNIFGIPNVSMVAFCQRPGYHEVAFWGGWENESYYLPDRATIFDENLAQVWSEHQRQECADAALRINMELARQGLRTDHTYGHHGKRSQGYQMAMQNIWSPYNLVGMHPPHVAQIFKPGTALPYYNNPVDLLFWGWDLDKGGLADGIGQAELQRHIKALGPAVYTDQTGLHPVALINQ